MVKAVLDHVVAVVLSVVKAHDSGDAEGLEHIVIVRGRQRVATTWLVGYFVPRSLEGKELASNHLVHVAIGRMVVCRKKTKVSVLEPWRGCRRITKYTTLNTRDTPFWNTATQRLAVGGMVVCRKKMNISIRESRGVAVVVL